jgi:HPt (histidine-containing phosphotransfer) domain-containing protein
MNNVKINNTFVFNPEIDANYLNSLYGDDFMYMQEVFETVLDDYQSLTDQIEFSYSSGNLAPLRSAVHKIKPVFGFVGLTAVQQLCQDFEKICDQAASSNELSDDYETLKNKIFQSKQIIEEEKKNLEIFNSNCS